MDTIDQPPATSAALILTLYGTGEAIGKLAELLVSRLDLAAASSDFWQSPGGEGWLRRFTPITNGDTSVVQIVLNPPGPAVRAWPQARRHMENALSEAELAKEDIWGYSLVYQAVVASEVDGEKSLETLLDLALPLYTARGVVVPRLARMEVPGGYLWLTHIADINDGPQASNVYVALGPAESETTLIRWLATPHAPLLEPDLLVHKSAYLRHQYHRNNVRDRYLIAVKGLSDATTQLLDDLGSDRGKVDPLETVAGMYDQVVSVVPIMEEIHIQMTTQLANFDYRVGKVGDREVFAFQRGRMSLGLQELELLLRRGRNALEAAGTTVEMVQARLAKVRAKQDRLLQMTVALVAVALAVPELVNQRVAAAILDLFYIEAPSGGYSTWALLGVQLAVMAAVALVIYIVMRLLARR